MAEVVRIRAEVDDVKALSSLQTLKSLCDQLNKTPVNIKINNGDGQKVTAAVAKVAAATEKTKQESLKLSQQQEKTAQTTNRLNQQMVKSASQTSKATSATQKATSAQKSFNQQAQEGSKITQILGDSLGNIAIKVAAWQLINGAVAGVKNSLKEALGTIKEVDSELATIRKVTGMTKEETQELGEGAYSTASKYGVEASEYLQNVASFARAGYGEAAQGLGELAIKTQLVGDTNAEIASQFLLSADAAWKFKGNIDQLSLVLDKANVIDNNYATSIEKIAEGIPIVGNVAAMAGMTVDETMAALGTITATTQESGRKAATALRALILNILGDTSTEIEEGVTATTESVESLGQILAKYAPEAVAAAEATGQLINPMEAIEALSRAAKEGLLTDIDQMQLVSALGGKLRTNQLMSLLENFDMYKSMLGEMATAAGSADKEVGVMLDTWENKANQLKNSWTEFVSNFANTEVIKGALDGVRGVLELLNTDFGQTVIQVGLVTAGVALLATGIAKAVGIVKTFIAASAATAAAMGIAGTGVNILTLSVQALTASLLANPLFWGIAAVAGVAGIIAITDKLSTSYEEQAAIVDELEAKQKSLYGEGGELERLKAKSDSLNQSERERLNVLIAQEQSLQNQIDKERKLEYIKWSKRNSRTETVGKYDENGNYIGEQTINHNLLEARVSDWQSKFEKLQSLYYTDENMSPEAYATRLSELFTELEDNGAGALREFSESGIALTETEQQMLDLSNALAETIAEISGEGEGAAESTQTVAESFKAAAEAADAAKNALVEYDKALKGLTDHEANANAMKSAYDKAFEDFQSGRLNTPELLSFIDLAVPPDKQRELGYNIEAMMNYAINSAAGRILSSGDIAGTTYDIINEMYSSGGLEGIVEMEGGVITAISSWKELANAMGISEGLAQSAVQSLMAYADTHFYTAEEAQNLYSGVTRQLEEAGKVSEAGTYSAQDFVNAFKDISGAVNETDLANRLEGFARAADVDWAETFGVDSAEAAGELLKQAIDESFNSAEQKKGEISNEPIEIKIKLDTEGVESEIANMEQEIAQVGTQPIKISAEVTNKQQVKRELSNVTKMVSGSETEAPINIVVSGADSAISEIQAVTEDANAIPSSRGISIVAFDNATAVITRIRNELATLKDKTVTVTVVQEGQGASGGTGNFPTAATGTRNAAGGATLVNDGEPVQGSAAELIVDKGKAYIANSGEPAIVNLAPGATVYNATETRDIFEGGIDTVFPAFAGGTGLGRPDTGVYSGSYNKGNGAGGSGASSRASSNDPLKTEIEDKLNNIDKQIQLAQNQNDTAREQALQQEAAKLVREYVQKYLDKGFSNTSDEVLDLLNRGYGYSDDLMTELTDSLEALTDSTNAANRLQEKKQAVEDAKKTLENVESQRKVRIFNSATGQWEWVAKAADIEKAQEALTKAEKDLQQEQISQEIEALKKGNIGDIGSLTVSGALRELISEASEEEQRRITDILHAISGGAKDTVDTSGESIFRSADSHDTYYQFGDLKLSEGEASQMTVKELADMLRGLGIT